jgi:hypothetical protein
MRLPPFSRRWWLLAALALVLLPGAGLALAPLYALLHRTFGFALDLATIGLMLFLIAALLAPLEALGWWAGWYGSGVEGHPATGVLAAPRRGEQPLARMVVYLDGIGQASVEALPEGEDFLRRLSQRLPDDIPIVRGIMPYSVVNVPLTEKGWLAVFWRWVDRLRLKNPRSLLGLIINLRNVTVVAVSADERYGPIYNQGIAQVIVDSLVANGYPLGRGLPITLLGFSGGGQISMGALPYLRRTLEAPIEVISLGGVFAGGNPFLQVQHLYHLVGERDGVERFGRIVFPRRWPQVALSYWNRAQRRGKVSLIPLGPVGHELPGGLLDGEALLPDGRSHLEQTLDLVTAILSERQVEPPLALPEGSSYGLARANRWHQLDRPRDTGPLRPAPGPFRPLDRWLGRLILPAPEQRDGGVDFEVFQAPAEAAELVGRTLRLHWDDPRLAAIVFDVHFSEEARYSLRQGVVHPVRLEGWRQVTPLESLAGARPFDDQFVALPESVHIETASGAPQLSISAEPRQTTGLVLALVQFQKPLGGDLWQAVAYDPARRSFCGPPLELHLPEPLANRQGLPPNSSTDLEQLPPNREGWYVAGVSDGEGRLVVQSMAPRALLRLAPERVISGRRAAWRYVKREAWADTTAGSLSTVLVSGLQGDPRALLDDWRIGDRLLVLHVYGCIGGQRREAAAASGIIFGHFAYGTAEVVLEPLAHEPSLAIDYHQVYAHNDDGLIAGAHSWWRYMGDRQAGWLGTRPVADILIRFPPFTAPYQVGGEVRSPLALFECQLAAMTARYRVGDGTGASFVGPANNCAQDSNQALFGSIRLLLEQIEAVDPSLRREWERENPEQAKRLAQLLRLERALRRELQPLGRTRADWRQNAYLLGSSLEDRPLANLARGLSSWRTMLPRLASDTVLKVFLEHGASALVLRTNQVGGRRPEIEPLAPLTL